jgi:hypothetical protein
MTPQETIDSLGKILERKKELAIGSQKMADPKFNKLDSDQWTTVYENDKKEIAVIESALTLLRSQPLLILDSEFSDIISDNINIELKSRRPVPGWLWAKCNDCNVTWKETSRDIESPSNLDCPNRCCNSEDTQVLRKEATNLPRDKSGNLLKNETMLIM